MHSQSTTHGETVVYKALTARTSLLPGKGSALWWRQLRFVGRPGWRAYNNSLTTVHTWRLDDKCQPASRSLMRPAP